MQIRQMLSVSPALRAAQKNTARKVQADTATGDAWALARVQELQKQGLSVQVRRYRAGEPLCVVYFKAAH